METVEQVIDAFGYARLASSLGIPVGTVSAWKSRASIPADKWLAITDLARAEGKEAITLETLARMHAERGAA